MLCFGWAAEVQAMILVQFDFPFAGPWGREMAAAMEGLAADIATEPGLHWKIWTEAPEEGRAGGLYLFETRAQAEAYRDRHAARIGAFGITGVRAILFEVNDALGAVTRAAAAAPALAENRNACPRRTGIRVVGLRLRGRSRCPHPDG